MISKKSIENFRKHLIYEEKSMLTVDKYIHDVSALKEWSDNRPINRRLVIEYKAYLAERYAPSSVNAAISSFNSFFVFCRKHELKIKNLKIQRQIFSTDRSNIWSEMKSLCTRAGVDKNKVFPHNLRHLFARTYYSVQKDIVRLADILGHSSVNTTRIYTMENGDVHRKQMQMLGLLLC